MIVVDTNVIAYLLIPGAHSAKARDVFVRDAGWAAPALWRSELRNVLALYLRQGHLSMTQAIEVQETAEEVMAGREYAVESRSVLELASSSGRSACDCEFVALARALGVPLVTSDTRVCRSFPAIATSLAEFARDRPMPKRVRK